MKERSNTSDLPFETDKPTGLTPEQVGAWLEASIHNKRDHLKADLDFARKLRERSLKSLDLVRRDLPSTINPHDLKKTGWGAIFPSGKKSQRKSHLKWLFKLREKQAGSKSCRTFEHRTGENALRFLRRHKETLGVIRPKNLPYYLLIVASPEEIPFEFQYHLSLSRAVGRIWFENPSHYQQYARAVWEAEHKGVDLPRQVTIFSTEHDETTKILGKSLVRPVQLSIKENFSDWKLTVRREGQADSGRLRQLLGGNQTPGLLLVSCHGRKIEPQDPERQRRLQGAIVCPSSKTGKKKPFTVEDLAPKAKPHGLISIFFSCYGAGTPVLDNFPHEQEGLAPEAALETDLVLLSKRPFLARLPLELLRRGALAVVGHIDRGWTTSFVWTYGQQDIDTTYSLEDSLGRLLRGDRLGHALRPLNRRYSQLAARLAQMFDLKRIGGQPNLKELGFYWTAVNDARNLIVIGDPAVYLRGRREPELTIRLDQRLLERIERLAAKRRIKPEEWVYKRLKGRL